MNREAQQKLTKLALDSPVDVLEVQIETGERAVIERAADVPQSMLVKGFDADGTEAGWEFGTISEEVTVAPSFYPSDVPFLAGTPAVFTLNGGKLQMAMWSDLDESMKSKMQSLKDVAPDIASSFDAEDIRFDAEGNARPPLETLSKLGDWVSGLGDAARKQLGEVQEAIALSSTQKERLETRLQQLVLGLTERGWTVVDESETPIPFSGHKVKLELNGRERSVTRMGQLGVGQVMLMEAQTQTV